MADATYRDRWQTARFRDIGFLTDSHDAKAGRRLAVHEFPGAELPVVEDLGGQAAGWSLNAYFIGPQYDAECVALMTALNQAGADWLIHPWLGRLWVCPQAWTRRESNMQQGFCTLSIEFVPGGVPPATPTPDTVDTAQTAINGLADRAESDFTLLGMSAESVSAFVASVHTRLAGVQQAIALAALPVTWSQQLISLVVGLKTDTASLIATPEHYAAAVRSLTDLIGVGADNAGLRVVDRPRLATRLADLSSTSPPVVLSGIAAADPALRVNLAAESALHSRLFLSAAMQVALADYQTDYERAAALGAIDAAYDQVLPSLPDAVFQAAVSARTALIEAVMAQDLQPQQQRDLVHPLPSTVLAQRMQVDEAALIARNRVRHPLFVRGRVYG